MPKPCLPNPEPMSESSRALRGLCQATPDAPHLNVRSHACMPGRRSADAGVRRGRPVAILPRLRRRLQPLSDIAAPLRARGVRRIHCITEPTTADAISMLMSRQHARLHGLPPRLCLTWPCCNAADHMQPDAPLLLCVSVSRTAACTATVATARGGRRLYAARCRAGRRHASMKCSRMSSSPG